jgi:ribosome biogenesis GTPase
LSANFGQCLFANCRHESEPCCAVKAAIVAEKLPRQRWESYQKLQRESRYTGNQAQF